MSRAWRLQFKGARYHIINRGVERRKVYRQRADYQNFEGLLVHAIGKFNLELYAYTLLPNHYHLVLSTPEGNLSLAMQWLQAAYVGDFNRTNQRQGPLFQGRFKAILVGDQKYLVGLSAYVHWNCVRAGLARSPLDYRWSSYVDYIKKNKRHDWVERETVLTSFGRHDQERRHRYREWLYNVQGKEMEILDEVKHGLILGEEKFVNWVREKFGGGETEALPQKRRVKDEGALERVVEVVAREYNMKAEQVREDLRRGTKKEARNVAVYLLWKKTGLPNKQTGAYFGIKSAAVSRAGVKVEERFKREPQLRKRIIAIEDNLSKEQV